MTQGPGKSEVDFDFDLQRSRRNIPHDSLHYSTSNGGHVLTDHVCHQWFQRRERKLKLENSFPVSMCFS